jgi:AraC-like DNA-binding protein
MQFAMAWAAPPPALRPYVHRYVGFVERTPEPLRRRELPSGDVHLIITFGPHWDLPDPDAPDERAERHTSFVAGLSDRHAYSEHQGFAEGMEVQFTPLGARAFLGVPGCELAHVVAPLDAVVGRSADALVGRLVEAPAWRERFALLDAAITARVAEMAPPPREVVWAWRRLAETSGALPVGALADELGWSRKRLIGRFREHVGVTPKLYARLLRFQAAVDVLRADGAEQLSLASVALDCGYYDQAHLNRDFRAFADTSPTDFLASRLPEKAGFQEGNSVQDGALEAA